MKLPHFMMLGSLFSAFCFAPLGAAEQAEPAPPALVEARKVAERYQFRGLHQLRATFAREAGTLKVEERWLDLLTGWTKFTVRQGLTAALDPLAKGIPENLSALPLISGAWVTDMGVQIIDSKNKEWAPTPAPRSHFLPKVTGWLSSLSLKWLETYRPLSNPTAEGTPDLQDLGPLVLTREIDQKVTRGGGEYQREFAVTGGLVTSAITRAKGTVIEQWENYFETEIDLTPPPEALKMFQFFSRMKPIEPGEMKYVEARSRTRKAFGFASAFDEKAGGLRIYLILPQSPAEKAGLKKGDLVTKIDGSSVGSVGEASPQILATKPEFELTVTRGEASATKVTARSLVFGLKSEG